MRACSGVSTRATPRASGPVPSTIPASNNRGPRPLPFAMASRTAVTNSTSLPQSRTVVAPRREIYRSPFNLLKVRVHVPKSGKNCFAADINFCSTSRNLYLLTGSGGDDPPVFNYYGRIGNRVFAGAVDQCPADERQRFGVASRDSLGDIGERGHAVRAGFSHKRAERAFVSVADGFEVIEFGISGDGCNQVLAGIKP